MLYKLEIFARDFAFRAFSPIVLPDIDFDYLAPGNTMVYPRRITAEKGDYAQITDANGNQTYSAIVDNVEYDEQQTRVTLKSLLSIFNAAVYLDSTAQTIEQLIADLIVSNFKSSSDPLQNIAGLTVATTSETIGSIDTAEGVGNLYDILTTALSSYGVAVNMDFQPQKKQLSCTIGTVPGTVTVEAELRDVLQTCIVLGDSYGQTNKVTVRDKLVPDRSVTYYLHTDGTVSSENRDRIYPVFFTCALIQAQDEETFAQQAQSSAYNLLSRQKYDNMIELTAANDSRVLPMNLQIGAPATVLHGGRSYRSILTGYVRREKTTTLVFGIVRIDLTKKLLMQQTRQQGGSGVPGKNGVGITSVTITEA